MSVCGHLECFIKRKTVCFNQSRLLTSVGYRKNVWYAKRISQCSRNSTSSTIFPPSMLTRLQSSQHGKEKKAPRLCSNVISTLFVKRLTIQDWTTAVSYMLPNKLVKLWQQKKEQWPQVPKVESTGSGPRCPVTSGQRIYYLRFFSPLPTNTKINQRSKAKLTSASFSMWRQYSALCFNVPSSIHRR